MSALDPNERPEPAPVMAMSTGSPTLSMAEFIIAGKPPVEARRRAAIAVCDTVGVILAGAPEAAADIIRRTIVAESRGHCRVLGTGLCASPSDAALANGVAAHAHDYDDMCFVSMAHPSCALVPSILATGELVRASGNAVLDAYIVGFEIECRLGTVMNPRHYHERGWHCTSSIGTLGAAAAAARILGLDAAATAHALGLAASRKTSARWSSRCMPAWRHATASWPRVWPTQDSPPAGRRSTDRRDISRRWTANALPPRSPMRCRMSAPAGRFSTRA